jgi:hypothetical protein
VAGPNPPAPIQGDGVVETFAWETAAASPFGEFELTI